MSKHLLRTPLLLLATLGLCSAPTLAQSSDSSGNSSSSGSPSSSGQSAKNGNSRPPISIETEMFTYKAVEHNSAVIACDTAQYLYQGALTDAPAGSPAPCTIANSSASRPGIVLVSSGSTLLSDFQIWRSDMATMQSLVARANSTCVAAPEKSAQTTAPAPPPPPHIRARGLLSSALGAIGSPADAASAVGSVLQMFSSNQSVTSVVGTVQDPALMNEVARQLRSLNVRVLVPELYNPNALGGIDYAHSPYLQSLQSLFDAYDKCSEAKGGYSADSPQAQDIGAVLTSIDWFLKATFAPPASKAPAANNDANEEQGAQTQGSPSLPTSHFASVLSADELPKKIGFSSTGAVDADSPWQHLLWVKALESGGSVTKESNLFGTKVLFGGGAVDTYSVFSLDGNLVCSGNVYSFQQPVNVKNFDASVRAPDADTPAKWISTHSTCAPLATN